MNKRLKSLDEGNNIHIADEKAIERIIKKNATKSKTYQHNKEVYKKLEKQDSNIIPLVRKITFLERCKRVIDTLFKIAIIFLALIILILIFS